MLKLIVSCKKFIHYRPHNTLRAVATAHDEMSSSAETEADICGANCGVAEVDGVKIKEEDCACKLLHSYSDKCRGEHQEQDKEECQKQMTKMHDNDFFRQPEKSHRGDCPICFLPMPLDAGKTTFYGCCSAYICNGCEYVHHSSNGNIKCPFCQEPLVDDEESNKRMMERIKANDPAAMSKVGRMRYREGDYDTAVEYYIKASQFGDVEAHHYLGNMYHQGECVEKDEEKKVYHWEKAAIGGHAEARHNLGCQEERNGNMEKAVKHFIIAANLGYEDSMKALWKYYSAGNITKEDLEATLRTHHAALVEMKSPERKAAEEFQKRLAKQKFDE